MKYHALLVIFRKVANCHLLQIIGGALRVKIHTLILRPECCLIIFFLKLLTNEAEQTLVWPQTLSLKMYFL